MNFFVNKAMGIGNSGVEHAQFYRAKLFRQEGIPFKFVFTDLIKELPEALKHWDIPEDEVINLWEFFVFGNEYAFYGAKKCYDRDDIIFKDLSNTYRIVQTLTSSGLLIKEHIEKSPHKQNGKDILLVSRYKVEIYDYKTMKKKIVFNEINKDRQGRQIENIHIYNFKDNRHLFFENIVMLQRYFFECLDSLFEGKNNFLLDRGKESEVALFNHPFLDINLIEIIHADHLGDRDDPSNPLWNNHYEYLLTHIDAVDKVVLSTELQRQDLLIDFNDSKYESIFQTIPVGGIKNWDNRTWEVKDNLNQKQPTKFVTASRLASEKHIDIAVKAISVIHEDYPNVIFDIYGQGGEYEKISNTIKEAGGIDYIKLKGHSSNIEEIFQNYDVFLSASFSEGFGLTYIEALDAGLPVITYKARFGAMELIQNGVNGYIVDFDRTNNNYNVEQLVKGIKNVLNSNYNQLEEKTRDSTYNFQEHLIAKKWRDLINEL